MSDSKESQDQSAEAAGSRPGRLSRLRFSKKKDMPGGLWLKCENCGQMIYRKELDEAGRVCPSCSFHFTLPGNDRVQDVLDDGTFTEHFADLTALDRLEFTDSVPYSKKIAKTTERLGQNEALICGLGTIEGRPVVIAVLDFKFMGGSMGEVVGEKVALACDLARRENRPLVIFTSSGGARMHEGALSLMQMAKTCAALSEPARFRLSNASPSSAPPTVPAPAPISVPAVRLPEPAMRLPSNPPAAPPMSAPRISPRSLSFS